MKIGLENIRNILDRIFFFSFSFIFNLAEFQLFSSKITIIWKNRLGAYFPTAFKARQTSTEIGSGGCAVAGESTCITLVLGLWLQ